MRQEQSWTALARGRACRVLLRRSLGVALGLLVLAMTGGNPVGGSALAASDTIVVATAADLVAALTPDNAGRRIVVLPGTYDIDTLLTVPDGAVLEGAGVMLLDDAGLPAGFAPGTLTALVMTANTPGDVLTLGDNVTVRGLQIVDRAGRAGNAIGVVSRAEGARLSATIAETEILNPNPHLVLPQGPTGCGVVALTLNPNSGADPPPHDGALINALMVRSLIRSTAATGCSVFAFNFAPFGSVSVTLAGNALGGSFIANGGVSRPDAVHDAEVTIQSHRNLFRNDGPTPCTTLAGWNLTGGSGSPLAIPLPETVRNTLRVHSVDDRIERFTTAIQAIGGRRFFANAGPSSDNRIDLQLMGTTISTPTCAPTTLVADFRLSGASTGNDALPPGVGNTVRAVIRGVTGSGPRSNRFADATGPSGVLPPALAADNRVEIVGNPEAFARTNTAIEPPPGPAQFTATVR